MGVALTYSQNLSRRLKMEFKQCTKCKEIKPYSEFSKNKRYKCGLNSWCKKCMYDWRINNAEKIKIRMTRYREENLDKIRESERKWRKNNVEKKKEDDKKWQQNNPEKVREANKRWRLSHPDKVREIRLNWNKRNKNKLKQYTATVESKIEKRLSRRLSKQIWQSLKDGKGKKHWEDLVGYSLKDLSKHLEKLFKKGMSWNNYGKWHIDHIIPISFFQFNSFNDWEFKYCWSLNNLQPLWAEENIRKYNKII